MNNDNSLLNSEFSQDLAETSLANYLDSNLPMQQYFIASGSYDDDEGDRYDGTQWYNR